MKMKVSLVLLLLIIVSIEIESDGPLKMIEGKVCEVKLYDYCESDNCLVDCPKKYGAGASAHCSVTGECLCDYPC
ncbi:hypothetical protein DEO72_LG2g3593 [Vigna unguiculata]|uniref:S locus-related glycoprotein 1 binding pollen coat protein n=1 Tax=Vigna unguiculata TaxID=3917 RepID=A0A4D6L448_VIGUN|nr:hypothetical protein DEO72_LG2g3593 [Vigna unguiculata]